MIFQLFSLQGMFHCKWCVLIVCPVSIKSERGMVYNGGPITGYRDKGEKIIGIRDVAKRYKLIGIFIMNFLHKIS